MNGVAGLPQRLGRFELKRELGRGAQATVWLAHDPRLDREVAVKRLAQGGAWAARGWLDEARAVSRLTHPNIVPVFEADDAGGQPYLVFEYVQGPTLAELLRRRGRLPAREAVTLVLGVLDALAAAHAQGLVHRDLKPSNVLVGADGRPRVMDFGIAARVADAGEALVVGTPGYMAPEAARGEAPTPAMDLFSAGVLLAELLAGRPPLLERDARRALERVQREDLQLDARAPVDDTLRSIVQRALARDPAQRPPGAAAWRAALAGWLQPPAPAPETGGHGTLEFLLRRIRLKGDFPALSESMARIQRVASSETENLASLAGEILKDVALTGKLLRLVNSAHFGQAGGPVSTVSRAVALVGFAGIRNLALSLLLLEHLRDRDRAAQLREGFVHALLAGTVAGALASEPREAEEAFLGALFQNLGPLLADYYLPEEAESIRRDAGPAAGAAEREAAAVRVLGIGFEELGVGVARHWGLPEELLKAMRAPAGEPPLRVLEGAERQRWLGRAANEVASLLVAAPDHGAAEQQLARAAARYAPALGQPATALAEAVRQGERRFDGMARALGLPSPLARRRPEARDETVADSLSPHRLQATLDRDAAAAPAAAPAMAEMLAAGIQDITNTMVADDFRLNEVLRMVLETMYRALGFRRVVFALRDSKSEALTGRFGLGDGVEAGCRAFRVALRAGAGADLFAAVCARGADTLIDDAAAPNIAARLPDWHRRHFAAPSFLLLPLQMKGASFALIYADKAEAGTIALGEKELSLLRTLRNQAVMAFRQSER